MKNNFMILFLVSFTVLVPLLFVLYLGVYAQEHRPVEFPKAEVLEVTVTAYSPSPHITDKDPLITASNKKVTPQDLHELRFIAMSPDLMKNYNIKYGDEVWVSFIVEDTMHKRIKNTIDIFMRNLNLARNFGCQKRKIIILKEH